jgi:hypothetical protein
VLLLYLCVTYITYKTEGFYTYTILDPGDHGQNSGKVAGYIFAMAVILLATFAFTWCLIWFRRNLTGGRIRRAKRDQQLVYENQATEGVESEYEK